MWFNIHFVRTKSHNSSIIQSNSLAIIYQKIRDESFDSLNGFIDIVLQLAVTVAVYGVLCSL